jgi:hypothetical protein
LPTWLRGAPSRRRALPDRSRGRPSPSSVS